MIFYFSCVSKERRDAYFVSDKVLLQSKNYYEELSSIRIKGGEREREREETQTQRKRKKQHTKKKRFRFDLLFCSSIHICFILFYFSFFRQLHLIKLVFFFLPSSFPHLFTPQFSFFSSGSQVGFRYFSIWTHIFALFSWICTLYWRFVLTLNFIAAKLHFFYVIS